MLPLPGSGGSKMNWEIQMGKTSCLGDVLPTAGMGHDLTSVRWPSEVVPQPRRLPQTEAGVMEGPTAAASFLPLSHALPPRYLTPPRWQSSRDHAGDRLLTTELPDRREEDLVPAGQRSAFQPHRLLELPRWHFTGDGSPLHSTGEGEGHLPRYQEARALALQLTSRVHCYVTFLNFTFLTPNMGLTGLHVS